MVSTIPFEWCMAAWWSQCTKYSTSRDHHSHVIFTIICWVWNQWNTLNKMVWIFNADLIISPIIDGHCWFMTVLLCNNWKMVVGTYMKSISLVFQWNTCYNQLLFSGMLIKIFLAVTTPALNINGFYLKMSVYSLLCDSHLLQSVVIEELYLLLSHIPAAALYWHTSVTCMAIALRSLHSAW